MHNKQRPTLSLAPRSHRATDTDRERIEQMNYGRSKLVEEGQDVKRHKIKELKKGQPQKQQKVGHEACLAKVVSERRKIEVYCVDGSSFLAELLEFDKYSIRVRKSNGETLWLFKSALKGFAEFVETDE